MKIRFVILLCVLPFGLINAQPNVEAERLNSFFADLIKQGRFHGSALVAQNGTRIYQKSFGLADIVTGTANEQNTRFELASLSKVFTAVSVMQLVEQSRVALDTPVVRYLETFPFRDITIRHLLSHTSGLPDFELFDQEYKANPARIFTKEDIIPALKSWGVLKATPGEQWRYSSPGMAVLALVVQKVSGKPFDRYLKDHIFKPAAMQNTYLLNALHPVTDPYKATPYCRQYYFSSDFVAADTMMHNKQFLHQSGGVEGPGLIVSTTNDLHNFDVAMFSSKLLGLPFLDLMFRPARLADGSLAVARHYPSEVNFGLGWFILPDTTAGKIVFHSGFKPGTNSILFHNLRTASHVIVLDNGNSPGLAQSGFNALRILSGQAIDRPKTPVTFAFGRAIHKGATDLALLDLADALKDSLQFTNMPRDWVAMGYEFFRAGYNDEALETYRTGFLLHSSNDFLCLLYGDALAKAGKKKEAISFTRRCCT